MFGPRIVANYTWTTNVAIGSQTQAKFDEKTKAIDITNKVEPQQTVYSGASTTRRSRSTIYIFRPMPPTFN